MIAAADNPFRTSRLLALPADWADASLPTLLARWATAGRRGALVGPHGTGKTTRLRALAAHLAAEGWRVCWVQWHEDGTTTPPDWRAALARVDARTVACLDGAENLGPLAAYRLRRFTRGAGGVLATCHRRAWTLPTLATYKPSEACFVAYAATLAPGCEAAARAAYAATGRNAHAAFRLLYLALPPPRPA
jgi:hypothetical protein